jgi:ABC-type Fe3+ transport system substrate-binding protein
MSVREFRDSQGRDWRAWDVAPDSLNSRIKNEDFLAALNYTGWIVFETRNENEKRRLYPIPKGWNELPDPELEALLEMAEPVPARRLRGEHGDGETAP